MKREVYIVHDRCSFSVVYADRKKGGRYLAASFNDVDSDLKKVTDWVNANPKLVLIDKPTNR